MPASDYLKDEESAEGSSTYIEFHSDQDDERDAYRLCSRGGRIREGVEDMGSFFGDLVPHVATYLFDGDATGVLQWLEVDQDDWDEYAEEYLDDDGNPIVEDDSSNSE